MITVINVLVLTPKTHPTSVKHTLKVTLISSNQILLAEFLWTCDQYYS